LAEEATMKERTGYVGTILHVDLTSGSIRKEPLSQELARDYLGGAGINARLAYDLIKPGIDPLSPDNVLIIGAGPLVGTLAPATPKTDAATKSPLTGTIGLSTTGHFGSMLKYAGYDHLVISGRAKKPVYLKILDDEVELCDASHLWGKDIFETTDALWREHEGAWVSCIGPAGENLVRFSFILTEKQSTWGRGGFGAVMGSKNLKALVVRGTKGARVYDLKRFERATRDWLERFSKVKSNPIWAQIGTMIGWEGYARLGYLSYKNWREAYPLERTLGEFGAQTLASRIKRGTLSCPSCPLGCKAMVGAKEGAAVACSCVLGFTWELGLRCDVGDYDKAVQCFELCNRYGIDHMTFSDLLGHLNDHFERGDITLADTQGFAPRLGFASTVELLRKVAYREGIGDILAEAWDGVVERFHGGSWEAAVQIKKLDPPFDLRAVLGTETFGQLVGPRGGHMNRSISITILGDRTPEQLRRYCASHNGVPEEALARIFSQPDQPSIPRITKWVEDYNAAIFSLGICNRAPITFLYDIATCAEIYSATSGLETSPQDLLRIGERIWNLQKAFNVREGFGRQDDMAPAKWMTEPLMVEGKEVPPIPRERVERLLDEYYDEREWDLETGIPTQEKLAALGLEDVAEDLRGMGT
jgi:aldehyde:ferredoxin oxidoreductase